MYKKKGRVVASQNGEMKNATSPNHRFYFSKNGEDKQGEYDEIYSI